MNNERWEVLPFYGGLYCVSDLGNVKSFTQNKVDGKYLKKQHDREGYECVFLHVNGVKKKFRVHQLVALAFIPNPENKAEIDHINTVRDDNRAVNLRWCTHKENCNNSESRKHFSNAMCGSNHPMYGKKHSEASIEKMRISHQKSKHRLMKAVNQMSLDGTFICRWDGVRQAASAVGIGNCAISLCCSGRQKTAGGFKWEFA